MPSQAIGRKMKKVTSKEINRIPVTSNFNIDVTCTHRRSMHE
jgi:hypothetical protein